MALLRNDTCSWIRGHLPTGTCDLTQLAATRLNCDKRTLQRRFERELSCRFSDLVDDVRAEMCLPLLESGVYPDAGHRRAAWLRYLRQLQPLLPAPLMAARRGIGPGWRSLRHNGVLQCVLAQTGAADTAFSQLFGLRAMRRVQANTLCSARTPPNTDGSAICRVSFRL